MKKIFYIYIFLLFSNNIYAAQDREEELNKLFNQLKNTYNNLSAKEIESKIWKLWTTHPSEQTLTDLLEKGSYYMSQNQLTSAHNVFSKAIELDPNWAEAWNKRATVFYMVGEFQKSQDDIDKVLELEERHFGALAGQGMVNIKLKNYDKAKRSYQKAQEIYPAMKSSKVMIEQIEELIKRQSI